MITEIIGLPGSGKSTLLKQLIAQSDSSVQLIELKSPYTQFRRVVLGIKAYISLSTQIPVISKLKPEFKKEFSRNLFWAARDRNLIGSMTDRSSYLMDEGIVQHLLGLIVWGGEQYWPLVESLIHQWIPKENLQCLNVEVPQELALERLKRRGAPCTWSAGIESDQILNRYEAALSKMVPFLRQRGVTVHQINTLTPPQDTIQLLTR